MSVKNLEESIGFYENVVGMKLQRRFEAGPGAEIAFMEFEEDGTKIELMCQADFKGQPKGMSLSLGFATADVRKKLEEVQGKGYEASPIISPNPQTQFFFIQDPDGIDIQFVQE